LLRVRLFQKNKLAEFCPAVIDYLDTPGIYSYANDALVDMGVDSFGSPRSGIL
jgi:hypothetical protein